MSNTKVNHVATSTLDMTTVDRSALSGAGGRSRRLPPRRAHWIDRAPMTIATLLIACGLVICILDLGGRI